VSESITQVSFRLLGSELHIEWYLYVMHSI
jgi:hypothetical protein